MRVAGFSVEKICEIRGLFRPPQILIRFLCVTLITIWKWGCYRQSGASTPAILLLIENVILL